MVECVCVFSQVCESDARRMEDRHTKAFAVNSWEALQSHSYNRLMPDNAISINYITFVVFCVCLQL